MQPDSGTPCQINKELISQDLEISAEINGQLIKLLAYTGAGTPVIDEQFLLEINEGRLPDLFKSSLINAKTVSGEMMPILGIAKLRFQSARGTYHCDL